MWYLNEEKKINLDEKYIKLLEHQEMEAGENNVIDMREDYTYGANISVKDETKLNDLKKTCKDLIDLTKEIIYH